MIHSRVHPLRSFPPQCYVKRDDELGFGISGTKVRKYSSLVPFLVSEKYKKVIVIGSSHSNHVLGITQLLIENGIQPILFLKGNPSRKALKGNFLFIRMLTSDIQWIDSSQWEKVESLAEEYAYNDRIFILPEGGCHLKALEGLFSLPEDIIRNEKENGLEFDHILIDAGTGLTAIATLLWFEWKKKKTMIHVVQMAGNESEFLERLHFFHTHFEKTIPLPSRFKLYRPRHGASFGSTNQTIFQEVRRLAREEGFLTDPIYSTKLFLMGRHLIQEEKLTGNILFLHAGGALTLTGFQDQLLKYTFVH